jgi:diadenosine tetraphosphate (Ap4A) HIT family hydrolase
VPSTEYGFVGTGQRRRTSTKVSVVPENPARLPDFTRWPSFPFEGDLRVKELAEPVAVEPPRSGEDAEDCVACGTPDEAYIWVSERWRVRAMDRPTGLPMVLILECRSHLDLGDLTNLLAAELGVMTVRLERAVRSLDGVARVHVNRWGDGSAHLHLWFLARPYGRLQLRGTFLSLWDDILPVIPETQWRENLAMVAAWLAEFGGRAIAEPPHIQWQSPSTITDRTSADAAAARAAEVERDTEALNRAGTTGSVPGDEAAGQDDTDQASLQGPPPPAHRRANAPTVDLLRPARRVTGENPGTFDATSGSPSVDATEAPPPAGSASEPTPSEQSTVAGQAVAGQAVAGPTAGPANGASTART